MSLSNKLYSGLKRGDFFISISRDNNHRNLNHPNGLKKYEHSREFLIFLSSNISYFFKNGIHIIFSGNLFINNPAEVIFDNYILHKEAAFENLNGKFAFSIFDENQRILYLTVDRVNSYKIFYKSTADLIQAGTDINYFKKADEILDMGAIGSYLINSAPMRNKTLYENILKVPASSFVKFDLNDRTKKIRRYWKIKFTDEYKNTKTEELIEELKLILIRSFKRRLSDNRKVLVSFSGGSDSRGLLALLTSREVNYDNIEMFTYKYGNVRKGDPAYISQKIAEKKGYKVRVLDEYNNNIENCINLNIKLGSGYAHFCTDVDVWETLRQEYSADDNKIMVGDIIDGVPYGFRGDYSRALEKNYIYPASFLDSYRAVFNVDYFNKIYNEYQNDFEIILEESKKYENVMDSMWHTYLDQRVSNILNVYRENFISYFIDVENPYYDNEVLDFLTKLPLELRLYKRIFLETYKKIDPEIMAVRYSSRSEKKVDLDNEIRNSEELVHMFSSKSRLDNIISENRIIYSLNDLMGSGKDFNYTKYLHSIHKAINKVFPNYYRILLKDNITRKISKRLKYKHINSLYSKYMILRGVLSQSDSSII